MVEQARHPAGRDQRLPLRQPHRRRGARRADGDPDRQEPQGREAAQARRRQLLHEDRRPRWTRAFKDVPRGDREHRSHRGRSATSSSSSTRRYLPTYKVPEGETPRHLPRRASSHKGLERRFERAARRAASRSIRTSVSRARASARSGVIQKMGFSGYFLIVWDFINWAKEHGIPVGPGRGSGAGSLVACVDAHHRHRSDRVQAAVRALPQPRARVDAGLRRRLLHEPARRGHQVRPGQVRQGPGRPDRHVPPAQGARRDPRHRARDGDPVRRGRQARQAGARAGRRARRPPVREAIEQTPELKQLYNESPMHRELLDHRRGARGPQPPRRHARRRAS